LPNWSEDFSSRSLEDVIRSQAENRAWNKELRERNTTLVNNRLAHLIDQVEYTVNRKLGNEHAAECRRRANILFNEISNRVRQ